MSEHCEHIHEQHLPSKKAITDALAHAKAVCVARGQRWTAPRQRVFELLLRNAGPVKAYDLLAQFKAGTATAPPTVYRALDTLVSLGLVHRIASLNAFVVCSHAEKEHAATFLFCDCCGSVEEIAVPTAGMRDTIKRKSGFEAGPLTIEAHGHCRECQS